MTFPSLSRRPVSPSPFRGEHMLAHSLVLFALWGDSLRDTLFASSFPNPPVYFREFGQQFSLFFLLQFCDWLCCFKLLAVSSYCCTASKSVRHAAVRRPFSAFGKDFAHLARSRWGKKRECAKSLRTQLLYCAVQ